MINISKLYASIGSESDSLRYGITSEGPSCVNIKEKFDVPLSARERKPIVVWTMGRRCNLHCAHCYSDSENIDYTNELAVDEARAMLKDLAEFKIPALLLSGGEPLLHPYFFDLAEFASGLGIRLTLSTNGTLIDAGAAARIRSLGFSYVGISFDGLGKVNDFFRGKQGAFEQALSGLRCLKKIGQKAGLRFTLTRRNFQALPEIFKFVEQEKIDRVCFYHLVYSGRGSRISEDDLSHQQTRKAIDLICDWTSYIKSRNLGIEVLTVDNHADAPYVYMRLKKEDPAQAAKALSLLEWNGGGLNSSGVGIANIDSYGEVHPDQFWQAHSLGNIRQRPFSRIWSDSSDPLLAGLRNRLPLLKGRCGMCHWKNICAGSFRVRALQVFGDPWQEDPACYLTDEEISNK